MLRLLLRNIGCILGGLLVCVAAASIESRLDDVVAMQTEINACQASTVRAAQEAMPMAVHELKKYKAVLPKKIKVASGG